jgi:hypothetical protein
MARAQEIAECLCASFSRANGFAAPFSYFRARNLLPASVAGALTALPLPAQQPASGRRETVHDRFYLSAERLVGDALLLPVAEAFQSPGVTVALSRLCGAALLGTFLRIEYAIDRDGFWLQPHTDLGVKKLTGLIALSGGDHLADVGTDLYAPDKTPFSRVPFEANAGMLFVPGSATWHGFAPRPIDGPRKSLIVNYVAPEWQSREQLAFPDRPIAY